MRSYSQTDAYFTYISSNVYWVAAYTLADMMVTEGEGEGVVQGSGGGGELKGGAGRSRAGGVLKEQGRKLRGQLVTCQSSSTGVAVVRSGMCCCPVLCCVMPI